MILRSMILLAALCALPLANAAAAAFHVQRRALQQPQVQQQRHNLHSALRRGNTAMRVVPSPYFSEETNNDSNKASSPPPPPPPVVDASLFKLVDDAGQKLKPAAAQANAKAAALAESPGRKYLYMAKSCLLYSAFILYRAYRGFFVILPAVFRETFRKLQDAVDEAPFDETEMMAANDDDSREEDVVRPMKLRTRMTVSVLAAIVTASYVVGGAIRVGTTLIRSAAVKGELMQSFAAAASEQERNEDAILQKSFKQLKNDVNGKDKGLAP